MLTVYCEKCYAANAEGAKVCGQCGAPLDAKATGDYTDRLLWALHHPEPTVAPRAAWILGKRRDVRAVKPLMDITQHSQAMGLLEEAAAALGKIGDPAAIPALEGLLRDSYVSVRVRAARALGEIGDRRAVPALTAALEDRSEGVRAAARAALERLTG
jgi:HEAT repeat protein